MVRSFYESGITDLNGHLLYALPEGEYADGDRLAQRQGILALIAEAVATWQQDGDEAVDALFDKVESLLSRPGRTMRAGDLR